MNEEEIINLIEENIDRNTTPFCDECLDMECDECGYPFGHSLRNPHIPRGERISFWKNYIVDIGKEIEGLWNGFTLHEKKVIIFEIRHLLKPHTKDIKKIINDKIYPYYDGHKGDSKELTD